MATQKRGKLKRLSDPATTSRQHPLGAISAPVNQNFRVRLPGPKLRPVTDFSKLSSTIAEGLAIEGITQNKEDEKKQRAAAKKWHRENRDLSKKLTTLAKAVESGSLSAATTSIFWQQLSIERGTSAAFHFETSVLPKEVSGLIEKRLANQIDAEGLNKKFDEYWGKHVAPILEGNTFAQNAATTDEPRIRRDFIKLIETQVAGRSESSAFSLATSNITSQLTTHLTRPRDHRISPTGDSLDSEAIFTREFAQSLASSTNLKWLGTVLATQGTPGQAKSLVGAAFRSLDQFVHDHDGSIPGQILALELGLDTANALMGDGTKENPGMLVGSAATGYRALFRGGDYQESLQTKIDGMTASIERLQNKHDSLWTKHRKEVEGLFDGVSGHLNNLYRDNPGEIDGIVKALLLAQGDGETTHEELVKIFGEDSQGNDIWQQEWTTTLNQDPHRGPNVFIETVQEGIRAIDETATSTRINEQSSRFAEAIDSDDFHLAKSFITGLPFAVMESMKKRLRDAVDVDKHMKSLNPLGRAAAAKSEMDKGGTPLVGEKLEEWNEMLGQVRSDTKDLLGQFLLTPGEKDDRTIHIWNRDQPELKAKRDELKQFLIDAQKTQKDNAEKWVNNALSGKHPTRKEIDGLVAKGELSATAVKRLDQLRENGSHADTLIREFNPQTSKRLENYHAFLLKGGNYPNLTTEDLQIAIDASLKFQEQLFSKWNEKRNTAGTRWDAQKARDWYVDNRKLVVEVGKRVLTDTTIGAPPTAAAVTTEAIKEQFEAKRRLNTSEFLALAHPEPTDRTLPGSALTYREFRTTAVQDGDADKGLSVMYNTADGGAGEIGNVIDTLLAKYTWDEDAKDLADDAWNISRAIRKGELKDPPTVDVYNLNVLSAVDVGTGSIGSIRRGSRIYGPRATGGSGLGLEPEYSIELPLSAVPMNKIITADYLIERAKEGNPLDPHALVRITAGDVSIYWLPTDLFTEKSELGHQLRANVGEIGKDFNARRTITIHGRGSKDQHSEKKKANGFQKFNAHVAAKIIETLGNKDLTKSDRIKNVQAMFATQQIPTRWVLDGKATFQHTVHGRAEINASAPRKARQPSWSPHYTEQDPTRRARAVSRGTVTPNDVIPIVASVTTTYDIPFSKPNGDPLDFLSIHTMRFYKGVEAIKRLETTLDAKTGLFEADSDEFKLIEKFDVEVTRRTVAAFLKAQMEQVAKHDPFSKEHDVDRFINRMSRIVRSK